MILSCQGISKSFGEKVFTFIIITVYLQWRKDYDLIMSGHLEILW